MYTPSFVASDAPCVLQSFVETRSRGLSLNGLFFRSRQCGNFNNIHITCVLINSITSFSTTIETFQVRFTENSVVFGPYDFEQHLTVSTEGPSTETVTLNGVDQLRAVINAHAVTFHMPNDGFDVEDNATEPDKLTHFAASLTGGLTGPIDASSLNTIRTGPKYSLICITSTEDENGNPITPSEKISMWDGNNWIPFVE